MLISLIFDYIFTKNANFALCKDGCRRMPLSEMRFE